MILDYSIENYGPFKDKVTFSFQATRITGHPNNIKKSMKVENGILTSAFVFGPNASGKSNLLRAIKVLKMLIKQDNARSISDSFPFYKPFSFSNETARGPIKIETRFVINDDVYDYRIAFKINTIVYESLSLLTDNPTVIFERDNNGIKSLNCIDVSDKTAPYMPYLTVATMFNDHRCTLIYEEINSIIFLEGDYVKSLVPNSYEFISKDKEIFNKAMQALKVADFAISSVVGKHGKVDLDDCKNVFSLSMYEKLSKKGDKVDTLKLEVVHSYVDVPDNLSTLPMDSESNGTVGMFALVGPIIDSLINGRTIVIDEFGTYLHPEIIKWLVSLFSNEQNPKNGQLIACTQELALLNLDLLRRDQIYFTNKNYKSGSCELYSLSDFTGIRNDSNIIKLYLDGRFDAVPIIHRGGVI